LLKPFFFYPNNQYERKRIKNMKAISIREAVENDYDALCEIIDDVDECKLDIDP